MNGDLRKQFAFYLQNQPELVKDYNGKVVVIIHEKVEGAYDSELEALAEASKRHKMGEFLLQKVSPGDEQVSQAFHSRVSIQ